MSIIITCSNCKTDLYETNQTILRSEGINPAFFNPINAEPNDNIFICPVCWADITNDMRIALFANAGD